MARLTSHTAFDLLGAAGDEEEIENVAARELPVQERVPSPKPAPRRPRPAVAPATPPGPPRAPQIALRPGKGMDIVALQQECKYTKLCHEFMTTGHCSNHDCWYAHSQEQKDANRARVARRIREERAKLGWVDPPQQQRQTWQQQSEFPGASAAAVAPPPGLTFRHRMEPAEPLASKPPVIRRNYKTVMCRHWRKNGFCPFEASCNFAHGPAELRSASGGPYYGDDGAGPSSSSSGGGYPAAQHHPQQQQQQQQQQQGGGWTQRMPPQPPARPRQLPTFPDGGGPAPPPSALAPKQMDAAQLEQLMAEFDLEDEIEDAFICPITQEQLRDPVVAADGYTYERSAIEDWFAKGSSSPMTGQELGDKALFPNITLRKAMAAVLGSR